MKSITLFILWMMLSLQLFAQFEIEQATGYDHIVPKCIEVEGYFYCISNPDSLPTITKINQQGLVVDRASFGGQLNGFKPIDIFYIDSNFYISFIISHSKRHNFSFKTSQK